MKAVVAVFGASVIGSLAICDVCVPAASAVESSAVSMLAISESSDSAKVKFNVDGMTCGGCALSARLVLEKLDGVIKAEVNYEKKLAVVTYDPAKITPEKMIAALKTKLKYTATVLPDTVR